MFLGGAAQRVLVCWDQRYWAVLVGVPHSTVALNYIFTFEGAIMLSPRLETRIAAAPGEANRVQGGKSLPDGSDFVPALIKNGSFCPGTPADLTRPLTPSFCFSFTFPPPAPPGLLHHCSWFLLLLLVSVCGSPGEPPSSSQICCNPGERWGGGAGAVGALGGDSVAQR